MKKYFILLFILSFEINCLNFNHFKNNKKKYIGTTLFIISSLIFKKYLKLGKEFKKNASKNEKNSNYNYQEYVNNNNNNNNNNESIDQYQYQENKKQNQQEFQNNQNKTQPKYQDEIIEQDGIIKYDFKDKVSDTAKKAFDELKSKTGLDVLWINNLINLYKKRYCIRNIPYPMYIKNMSNFKNMVDNDLIDLYKKKNCLDFENIPYSEYIKNTPYFENMIDSAFFLNLIKISYKMLNDNEFVLNNDGYYLQQIHEFKNLENDFNKFLKIIESEEQNNEVYNNNNFLKFFNNNNYINNNLNFLNPHLMKDFRKFLDIWNKLEDNYFFNFLFENTFKFYFGKIKEINKNKKVIDIEEDEIYSKFINLSDNNNIDFEVISDLHSNFLGFLNNILNNQRKILILNGDYSSRPIKINATDDDFESGSFSSTAFLCMIYPSLIGCSNIQILAGNHEHESIFNRYNNQNLYNFFQNSGYFDICKNLPYALTIKQNETYHNFSHSSFIIPGYIEFNENLKYNYIKNIIFKLNSNNYQKFYTIFNNYKEKDENKIFKSMIKNKIIFLLFDPSINSEEINFKKSKRLSNFNKFIFLNFNALKKIMENNINSKEQFIFKKYCGHSHNGTNSITMQIYLSLGLIPDLNVFNMNNYLDENDKNLYLSNIEKLDINLDDDDNYPGYSVFHYSVAGTNDHKDQYVFLPCSQCFNSFQKQKNEFDETIETELNFLNKKYNIYKNTDKNQKGNLIITNFLNIFNHIKKKINNGKDELLSENKFKEYFEKYLFNRSHYSVYPYAYKNGKLTVFDENENNKKF